MKILVTGGAGFIGSHLVEALLKQKHKVVVIDNLSTGSRKNLKLQANFYKLDIRDKKGIARVFKVEKPQVVYHLAAQMDVRTSLVDPLYDTEVNVLGSLNLLEAATKTKIKKFIFASSGGAIYGDQVKKPTLETELEQPMSPYGAAKLIFEKYLYVYSKIHDLPFTSLRLANIYGPRQNSKGEAGVVAIFCDRLKNNKTVYVNGSGNQTRDFLYVSDTVGAFLKVLRSGKNKIYNIGTSKETSVNQIADVLMKIGNKKVKVKHRPGVLGEQLRSCLAYNKAKCEIGWQPKVEVKKGLKMTFEWFSKNSR